MSLGPAPTGPARPGWPGQLLRLVWGPGGAVALDGGDAGSELKRSAPHGAGALALDEHRVSDGAELEERLQL